VATSISIRLQYMHMLTWGGCKSAASLNVSTLTVGCLLPTMCLQPNCKRELNAAALRSLLTLAEWAAVLDVV
jgi:hypothetical protein